jgi:hypothetical protein
MMLEHGINFLEQFVEDSEANLLAAVEYLSLDFVEDIDAVVDVDQAVFPLVFYGLVLLQDQGPLLAEKVGQLGDDAVDGDERVGVGRVAIPADELLVAGTVLLQAGDFSGEMVLVAAASLEGFEELAF